jgi:small subunit ribosomal protein S1
VTGRRVPVREGIVDIIVAEHAGFCFGVMRALDIAEDALGDGAPVYSMGPLIHNPQVVRELADRGLTPLDEGARPSGVRVVLRTHGVPPDVVATLRARDCDVVDATCPFVKRVHEEVRRLLADAFQVVVVGERDHPEVAAIVGHAGGNAMVIERPEEVLDLPPIGRVGVVAQTTQSPRNFEAVVKALRERAEEIRVCDTICSATERRQQAALEMASRVDLVLVIGGRESGNTRRLAEICAATGVSTRHVETADELRPEWFHCVERLGITAGASTPDWIIEQVIGRAKELSRAGRHTP